MPIDKFNASLDFIFSEEGYGNNALPGDIGGLTIWGISAHSWPSEVALMSKMTPEAAKGKARLIYFKEYWQPLGIGNMEWPMCVVALDTAVNCGGSRLKRFMSDNWQDVLCARTKWLLNESKSRYAVSLLNRVSRLLETAKKED